MAKSIKVSYQCDECGHISVVNYRPGVFWKCPICGLSDYLNDAELNDQIDQPSLPRQFVSSLPAYNPQKYEGIYECDECGMQFNVKFHSGAPIRCPTCGHVEREIIDEKEVPARIHNRDCQKCMSCPFDFLVCQECEFSVENPKYVVVSDISEVA